MPHKLVSTSIFQEKLQREIAVDVDYLNLMFFDNAEGKQTKCSCACVRGTEVKEATPILPKKCWQNLCIINSSEAAGTFFIFYFFWMQTEMCHKGKDVFFFSLGVLNIKSHLSHQQEGPLQTTTLCCDLLKCNYRLRVCCISMQIVHLEPRMHSV